MKSSSILGIASVLVRGKKYRLLLTGVQFAYLGYKYYQSKKSKTKTSPVDSDLNNKNALSK